MRANLRNRCTVFVMLSWFRPKATHDLPEHLATGLWGEKQAETYLKQLGFKIIGRRVRVGKKDELDMLARDGDTLVFIEVKTRRNEDFGRAVSAVDRKKRFRMSRAAVRYMKTLRKKPDFFRFDVVEVIGQKDSGVKDIHHIPNAFTLHRTYSLPR